MISAIAIYVWKKSGTDERKKNNRKDRKGYHGKQSSQKAGIYCFLPTHLLFSRIYPITPDHEVKAKIP
jgi:hypothetical protein